MDLQTKFNEDLTSYSNKNFNEDEKYPNIGYFKYIKPNIIQRNINTRFDSKVIFSKNVIEENNVCKDSSTEIYENYLTSYFFIDLEKFESSTDFQLDYIFEYFDNLIEAQEFSLCRKILSKVDVENYSEYILIAFLTATYSSASEIGIERKLFYERVKEELKRKKIPNYIKAIEGLIF